jgi:hypothetical protein
MARVNLRDLDYDDRLRCLMKAIAGDSDSEATRAPLRNATW